MPYNNTKTNNVHWVTNLCIGLFRDIIILIIMLMIYISPFQKYDYDIYKAKKDPV